MTLELIPRCLHLGAVSFKEHFSNENEARIKYLNFLLPVLICASL